MTTVFASGLIAPKGPGRAPRGHLAHRRRWAERGCITHRNVFQCDAPLAMIQAQRAIVQEQETPERAYELFKSRKHPTIRTGAHHAR